MPFTLNAAQYEKNPIWNPSENEIYVNRIYNFSSYLTENGLCLHNTNQPTDAANGTATAVTRIKRHSQLPAEF